MVKPAYSEAQCYDLLQKYTYREDPRGDAYLHNNELKKELENEDRAADFYSSALTYGLVREGGAIRLRESLSQHPNPKEEWFNTLFEYEMREYQGMPETMTLCYRGVKSNKINEWAIKGLYQLLTDEDYASFRKYDAINGLSYIADTMKDKFPDEYKTKIKELSEKNTDERLKEDLRVLVRKLP